MALSTFTRPWDTFRFFFYFRFLIYSHSENWVFENGSVFHKSCWKSMELSVIFSMSIQTNKSCLPYFYLPYFSRNKSLKIKEVTLKKIQIWTEIHFYCIDLPLKLQRLSFQIFEKTSSYQKSWLILTCCIYVHIIVFKNFHCISGLSIKIDFRSTFLIL